METFILYFKVKSISPTVNSAWYKNRIGTLSNNENTITVITTTIKQHNKPKA